jgi:hypothetical protein
VDEKVKTIEALSAHRLQEAQDAVSDLYATIHRSMLEQRLVDTQPDVDSIQGLVPSDRWAKKPYTPVLGFKEDIPRMWEEQQKAFLASRKALAKLRAPRAELEAKKEYFATTPEGTLEEFSKARIHEYGRLTAQVRQDEEVMRDMYRQMIGLGDDMLKLRPESYAEIREFGVF